MHTKRIFEIVQSFPNLQVNTWNLKRYPLVLEITYHKVNKGKAVKHICKYLGLSMKDALCFGDGFNDRDMLIRSGWGVAMANAPLEIKIVVLFLLGNFQGLFLKNAIQI